MLNLKASYQLAVYALDDASDRLYTGRWPAS